MTHEAYSAVYDFELMPYALGDVLTWNVQTAIRCEELGRERVDVLICMDERYPSSIYQSNMVTAENSALFLNELFGAFGTHPRLGSIVIDRRREETEARLSRFAVDDTAAAEALADYRHALANRHDNDVLVAYFTKYIYYHEGINAFAQRHGRIPWLQPSMGCGPDVEGLIAKRLAGKRIVPVHLRMRRLDIGYRGEHTYERDSDFLEWYEFLRDAGRTHPDVQFILLGRLQEKPLELLALPNVLSLREFGLGLGHELTLMLRSDLFIGSSSGFAAMANFSRLPYFITRMNRESCNAYRIPFRAERLPFATERQILVYEPESRELLLSLLERGLRDVPPRRDAGAPKIEPAIDVTRWDEERARWRHPDATTTRFFSDETYRDKETAFLVWPKLEAAAADWLRGSGGTATATLSRLEASFPRLCRRFPEYLRLKGMIEADTEKWGQLLRAQLVMRRLREHARLRWRALKRAASATRYVILPLLPLAARPHYIWKKKHKIPAKLAELARRFAAAARKP